MATFSEREPELALKIRKATMVIPINFAEAEMLYVCMRQSFADGKVPEEDKERFTRISEKLNQFITKVSTLDQGA